MVTLYKLLKKSTLAATDLQRDDGSMPPGHNGLYEHTDTPVPNTARWLIAYTKSHQEHNNDRIKSAATNAKNYLYAEESRPYSETFYCRDANNLDKCNGLMGQALCIYALYRAYRALRDSEACKLAKEVFLKHPFDFELGVWKRVDIDGSVLAFDPTFNHQLWFAAAGGFLSDSTQIDNQIKRFLDELPNIIDVYSDGLIKHPLRISGSLKYRLKKLADPHHAYVEKNTILAPYHHVTLRTKAIGYHSVNLYGLALLKSQYPDHPVWENDIIKLVFEYIYRKDYLSKLYGNPRGFINNATGFQNAYAIHEFSDSKDDMITWASEQIRLNFDNESYFMNKSANDSFSQASAIYTASVLPNFEIDDQDTNIRKLSSCGP